MLVMFDQLPVEKQRMLIYDAFRLLCATGNVPYGIETGDDGTWDEYAPAIELAEDWYNEVVTSDSNTDH